MQELRTTQLAKYSERIFQHAKRIAEKSGVEVAKPRTTGRQQHRANVEAATPQKYFERAVLLPFLDYIISQIDSRFSSHVEKVSSIQGLLPQFLTADSTFEAFEDAVHFYQADLPNADVVDEEFARWKTKWLAVPLSERPSTLETILKPTSSGSYPNLVALLKIYAVLPLSSVSCERSASTLRRLHTWLRCNQTEHRLSSLALIHTHYTHTITVKKVCELFLQKHPRRLDVGTPLAD